MEAVQAINNICLILGDEDGSRQPVVARLLPLVWNTLNLGVSPNVKTCCSEVDFHLRIDLPPDFIRATKVGLLDNGCIYPLLDSKRTRTKRLKIKCKDNSDPQVKFHNPSETVRSHWGVTGEVYWLGDAKIHGYYRQDDGALMFSSDVDTGDMIVMEYLSNEKDLTYIPDEIFMVVAHRVAQKYWGSTDTRKSSYHEEQFKTELRQYNRTMRDQFDIEAISDALRGNAKSSIR